MKEIEGFENDSVFHTGKTLLVDADILVYRPCCVFNEDTEHDREMIAKTFENQLDKMIVEAGCDHYQLMLTTKVNFRDFLVDDYKANRDEVERPVNLAWAKRYAMQELGGVVEVGLEADDLLGIYADENTVIWSLDKDLRQIPGKHLDDETRKVITVTPEGTIKDLGKKVYFDGEIGMYYQLLVGDGADNIIGCGMRVQKVYKSGAKEGQSYVARKGIGPKAAMKILATAAKGSDNALLAAKNAVIKEYKKLHGDNWKDAIETQANLLWMVREQEGDVIKQWTVDGRDQYFNFKTGEIVDGFPDSD
jgi:5'-3' exonuclease